MARKQKQPLFGKTEVQRLRELAAKHPADMTEDEIRELQHLVQLEEKYNHGNISA